jgi:hypothetical protein
MYFKVIPGYGEMDYVEIDESEVHKAIRAQITGKVFLSEKEGTVSGNSIIRVAPDLNRLGGYKRGYRLTSEDYDHIPRKKIQEHKSFLELSSVNVERELKNLPPITNKTLLN